MSPRNCRSDRDRGQATVEFALTLPLIVIIVLMFLQVLVVVLERVQVINATRNAVRAAVVSADPVSAANRAARRSYSAEFSVNTQVSDDWVKVEISRRVTTDLPIVGRFIPDFDIASSFTMMLEPPLG